MLCMITVLFNVEMRILNDPEFVPWLQLGNKHGAERILSTLCLPDSHCLMKIQALINAAEASGKALS